MCFQLHLWSDTTCLFLASWKKKKHPSLFVVPNSSSQVCVCFVLFFATPIASVLLFHASHSLSSSPSSCAAELEVGAKEKKSFVQKSIFYGEFVKNIKQKQIIKYAVLFIINNNVGFGGGVKKKILFIKVNVSTVTHTHTPCTKIRKKTSMVQTKYQLSKCHMSYFVHYGCFYTGTENSVATQGSFSLVRGDALVWFTLLKTFAIYIPKHFSWK